ncbi:MAG: RHS repeat-associated core domain-containing protein, partial [Clostridia bacterium]|nr:RHS repeat-associated core domain-containing protein [Clostridia bacterium]
AGGGMNAEFTYDHTGLRVKKTVNDIDTLYTWNGTKMTHIRKGDTQMHFFYDSQGRPSLIRYNGVDYAYFHNLQGDVLGLFDMSGAQVVQYTYGARGKLTSTEGNMAGTLGLDNPFRYRGYVYDEETGLYYLRSRYYNPEWGRFINADTVLGNVGGLLSHNLFAYCRNNPVSMIDSTGFDPIPWSVDNWSRVIDLSQLDAYNLNKAFRNGTKANEPATLHILTNDSGIISIAVELDQIGNNYHIDTWFQNETSGRNAFRTIIGAMKGLKDGKMVKNSSTGFKIKGNPVKLPAYLEMSDGTLAACAVQLHPHVTAPFVTKGGHFDMYLKDSKKNDRAPDQLVINMRALAIKAYHISLINRWKNFEGYNSTRNGKWQ